jgi:hypothetical protein
MSLKRIKKQNPNIANQVMGPAAKDKAQAAQKPNTDYIMAKLDRMSKMKKSVEKLNKGEDPNEDLLTLDPTSHAIAQKQMKHFGGMLSFNLKSNCPINFSVSG